MVHFAPQFGVGIRHDLKQGPDAVIYLSALFKDGSKVVLQSGQATAALAEMFRDLAVAEGLSEQGRKEAALTAVRDAGAEFDYTESASPAPLSAVA